MKICIDCAPLLVRSAGVKTYIHHWLRALREREPESVVTFLEPARNGLDHQADVGLLGLAKLWTINLAGRGVVSRLVPECAVFHVSNQIRRLPTRPKISATIHDLTSWIVPEFHTLATKAADRRFAEGVLRSAAGLICVSENTRRDAERILRIDPNRMMVISPGVPESYFRAGEPEARAAAAALDLRRPYFLFVGTIEPRKNVDGLISAWLSLSAEFRQQYELVVAGMPGWHADATLRRLQSDVRYLGYVDERWTAGLTAGARALVYPSFYEGFGFPVAQALAAGCPVITSDVSSLPEVTGDAGLLVDPHSTQEIAATIRRLGESDSLCDRLRLAGRERARLFSWERSARLSLDFFRALAG